MIVVKFRVVVVVFFLNFLWTFANRDVVVSCDLKENCILPCQFEPGPEELIHWMTENIPVHSFYYNKDQLGNQDQRFKGRTSVFKDQISSGNASLLLRDVNFQDEGRYRCYTSTTRGNQELYIQLTVDDKNSTNDRPSYWWILGLVVGLLLLSLGGILVYRKLKG